MRERQSFASEPENGTISGKESNVKSGKENRGYLKLSQATGTPGHPTAKN